MGLWMIQSVRHELQEKYSFAQLCTMAEENSDYPGRVDVNDISFLSPDNMTEAIYQYLTKTGQPLPKDVGELAACIYESLAECYAATVAELEEITGKSYCDIHIVGGGSNADYLNRLTARKTKKKVYAGPAEATAIGNITVQILAAGEFKDLTEARSCIYASSEIKEY
jgi:rhamnulokinase